MMLLYYEKLRSAAVPILNVAPLLKYVSCLLYTSEMYVQTIDNMVASIMGRNARRFVNYICAIFMFILFCNLSGLLGLSLIHIWAAFPR